MCQALSKGHPALKLLSFCWERQIRWRQLQFNKRTTLMKVSTRCYEDPQRQLTLR